MVMNNIYSDINKENMKKQSMVNNSARKWLTARIFNKIIFAFFLFVLTLSFGCSEIMLPPLPIAPVQETEKPHSGLTKEQLKMLETEVGDYKLGAGDQIEVYSVDVVEINRKYVIGPDGKVTLPVIGVISLDRLTREQAAAKIESLLKSFYIDPKISIIVDEFNNNRIFVLGEVRKPGQYNFPGRPLLLSSLARAEGLTDKADLRGCTVLRGNGMVIEINLYDLLRKGDRTLNIPLLPEDTVYVRASDENTFYVLGEVQRPGVFARGEKVDVLRAIAMAGGETRDAQLSVVRVLRREKDGPPKIYEVNVAGMFNRETGYIPSIESGDILYVPRKGVATFNYYLTQITPSMYTILLGATLVNIGK